MKDGKNTPPINKGARRDRPFGPDEFVASTTECTGLQPTLPDDTPQARAYAELYAIHETQPDRDEDRKARNE